MSQSFTAYSPVTISGVGLGERTYLREISITNIDGTLFIGGPKPASNSEEIMFPGQTRWNPKDQTLMAYHTIAWRQYAEATNHGEFDLRKAFSSFKPYSGPQSIGFSVAAYNLLLKGRRFGFSASVALYTNTRGQYNSIVNFNANEQWHEMKGVDGKIWQYNINRNGKASMWGTQGYNFDFVNDLLYPDE